jgi:hypothetical protein
MLQACKILFLLVQITCYRTGVLGTLLEMVLQPNRVHAHKWEKPASGQVKCNVDVSFSSLHSRVCIGICIRDEFGAYVLAKYEQFTSLSHVKIDEALGLISTLYWVHELNLGPVDFELDLKVTVDKFHSNKHDDIELEDIILHYRRLFSTFYNNSGVKFIRR